MIKELKKDQIIKCSDNFDFTCYCIYKVLVDFDIYKEAAMFKDDPFNIKLILFMDYLVEKKLIIELKDKEVIKTTNESLDLLE